jgi:hypothetical protein
MRKWGILAACLPVFVSTAVAAAVPARYLDEQRCLAVLNIAAAAFETIEEPSHAAHALRKDIETGYDRLKVLIAGERDLTERQIDKGLDVFDGEQRHWLDAFGDASEEPARGIVVEALMKKAHHCLKAMRE